MSSASTIPLCKFIHSDKNSDIPKGLLRNPASTNIKSKGQNHIVKACKSCFHCAWREEQSRLAEKRETSSSFTLFLQNICDLFLGHNKNNCSRYSSRIFANPIFLISFFIILSYHFVHGGVAMEGTNPFPNNWSFVFYLNVMIAVMFLVFTVTAKSKDKETLRTRKEVNPNRIASDILEDSTAVKKTREQHYAKLLSHAIQYKTISYSDPEQNVERDEQIQNMCQFLKSKFPTVYTKFPPQIIHNYSLLFKIPGSDTTKKPFMLCSHLDVVPAPNEAPSETDALPWKQDPFSGIIVDGVIWGRGAIDNKHNVIAQLGALEELLSGDSKLQFKRTMYIAIGHDEEVGGRYGASNIAKVLKKQKVQLEFILDEGTMMISGALPGSTGNIALIGCSEKGNTTIELSVHGTPGHSSIPPIKGESPTLIMSKAIIAVETHNMPAHFEVDSPFRKTLHYVAQHLNFPFNFICSHLAFFAPLLKQILLQSSNGAAASIRTTTAITKINGGTKLNVLPDKVSVCINHRVHPLDTVESIIQHHKRVINDKRVNVRVFNADENIAASPVSSNSSYGFQVIEKTVNTIFNNICAPTLMIGNTDTRWYWDLSQNIYRFSAIELTMDETKMFHGYNERISIEALTKLVDFYKSLIHRCQD